MTKKSKFGQFIKVHDRLIVRGKDGYFKDKDGTLYAVIDEEDSLDDTIRLGVFPFALPESDPLNDAARAHDYAYSSEFYQKRYTREEVDNLLEMQLKQLAGDSPIQQAKAFVLSKLARLFGRFYWENKETK